MEDLVRYGWKRLVLNVLALVLLTYELGTPGHSPLEAISLVFYIIVLGEAITHIYK